jgi:hypothetical protein
MTDKDYYDKEKIHKREEESNYQDRNEALLQKYDDNRDEISQKRRRTKPRQ